MGKRNKSKRFVQQGKNAVTLHDQRIPYHTTYSEMISQKENQEQNLNVEEDL